MPIEKRVAAADAFWRDDQGMEQQAEATVLLSRRLKFRTKSIQALPVERRAKHLASVIDLSDALAGRAIVAYHFAAQRPLMITFLDALGIAHDNGLITADDVPPPPQPQLIEAVEKLRAHYPADAVELYLRTLLALDGDTWTGIRALMPDGADS
jgi:hypothetical protein